MSFSGKYSPPELPEDKKDRFVYGLAVFSDDGCNVSIKGNVIHQRAGQGQHLPTLGDSFHLPCSSGFGIGALGVGLLLTTGIRTGLIVGNG